MGVACGSEWEDYTHTLQPGRGQAKCSRFDFTVNNILLALRWSTKASSSQRPLPAFPAAGRLSKPRRADALQDHGGGWRGPVIQVKRDRHPLLWEGGHCPYPMPRHEWDRLALHTWTVGDPGWAGLPAQERGATCSRPAPPLEVPWTSQCE